MSAARSRAPWPTRPACSKTPTAARCSSTKSPTCRRAGRPSCSACCSSRKCGASARPSAARWTCGWWRPPTATCALEAAAGALPAGPAVPDRRHPHPDSGAARAPRGHRRSWRSTSGAHRPRASNAPPTLTHALLAELTRYHWPGNVRELQNVIAALAVAAPARGLVRPVAAAAGDHRRRQRHVAAPVGSACPVRAALRRGRARARVGQPHARGRGTGTLAAGPAEDDGAARPRGA